MTIRQFHLVLLTLMLVTIALVAWIEAPTSRDLPQRLQPTPRRVMPQPAHLPPTEAWIATPRTAPAHAPNDGANPWPANLLEAWRGLPIQAGVLWPDPPALFNHLRLSPPGQVRRRLAPGDRDRLWAMLCRLLRQSPGDLEFLGFDDLLAQAETARQVAFLATTRAAYESFVRSTGGSLPPNWEEQEGSPRGTLVWWLALEFPADAQAPAPAGAFQRTPPAFELTPPGGAIVHYRATIGSLSLRAATRNNLLIVSPSLRVLETAMRHWDQNPASAADMPANLAEVRRDFDLFRQALRIDPAGDIRAFADGHLLADALEPAIPDNWLTITQLRKFEQLQFTGSLRPDGVEWTTSVIVPQRSIYDFIALDGPRQLDRYFQADSFGLASLRLNFPNILNYAGMLATQGYFGGKAQQTALFAVPMLNMTNLPDALGNEIAVSLAPSQDKTYLTWSLATPWRAPHTVQEISNLARLAGAPFVGPTRYRDESVLLPQFKAKMEFRYPILIEAPGGYAVPMRASPAGKDAAPPPNDNLLLIAANGWNLDDVVNVKQGRVKNLAESAQFQQRMRANAGDAAIQIYANLNHGFGYAYMTLLGELYGLPIGGTPLEEHLLPRSECFGPLGHLWISLSREKLPDPPPPAAAGKSSRLRFRIVWIMD